jgi:hypothetical protein
LTDVDVLDDTIKSGVNSEEYFAYASSYDGKRYIGLKFNQLVTIECFGFVVKSNVAKKLIVEEAKNHSEKTSELVNTGSQISLEIILTASQI